MPAWDLAIQRTLAIEAYAVLGWQEERELDEQYGMGLIHGALQAPLDAGLFAPQPLEPLACLTLSVLTEAALYIIHADDKAVARQEIDANLECLNDGLQVKREATDEEGRAIRSHPPDVTRGGP